jgi:sensor histidine kinase YesM
VAERVQFINNLYLLPVRMAATYSLIYWILPIFLFSKRYFLFALIFTLHAILFGLALWIVLAMITEFRFRDFLPFIRPLVLNYQIPATAAAIYLFKRWYLIQQYSMNLENEKLEAELKFLKSQIQPHFLFNTLNNLYALTLKKSDSAPDMVIQLSNLLEYSLYSGKQSEVDLQEELKQLTGYIDLEKLRFGDRLDITVDFTGDTSGKLIAPLLLLPFVENSFKHGAGSDHESPYIRIKARIEDNTLLFSVTNSYKSEKGEFRQFEERIGLKNVKRRLELIYPEKYKLDIRQDEKNFTVNLSLQLNSNPSE